MIGESRAMMRLLSEIQQVAGTSSTVLIQGETGTGKELVADRIHEGSDRSRKPLIKFNCAAVPESLLASELFGHERGAFTGAVQRRAGRFEQAHGGTLLLDEVGELSREAQVMLLRVLQEREVQRLGGSASIPVDVRLIAATNRDLGEDVAAGLFRRDLFYRLNVFPIYVPALRERIEDLPLLVEHFAAKHARRLGRPYERIDWCSVDGLTSYDWPGNIRELENAVERAIIACRDGVLRLQVDQVRKVRLIPIRTAEAERQAIESVLQQTRGRIAGTEGAARRLGVPASTLELRIRRLGIDKYRYHAGANRPA